ncbi:MAG: ribonuclease [Acidobacteriota bacterium]|jgi:ribonuclease D|nr:ribonuclease [Acidobacteriota bacterium]
MNLDYQVTYVNDPRRLAVLVEALPTSSALALDIETASWWDPRAERVSLIQLAYRDGGRVRVAVVDALAGFNVNELRFALESDGVVKAVHNASFDVPRLDRHLGLRVAPVHDTCLAARRGGERGCSLKAQAEKHLGLALDKGAQQSDWGARPLDPRQVAYAALDAAATLLLYEHQLGRGLKRGEYRPRAWANEAQAGLPLSDTSAAVSSPSAPTPTADASPEASGPAGIPLALLGVIAELPSRYGPERLAASVGEDRVGLAGWVVDRVLGREAEVEEDAARDAIASLCGLGLVTLTPERRLEASPEGREAWLRRRPV